MIHQDIKPAEEGYRMPAEWEPHSATQLHWPSNRETWPGYRLERVESVYLDIIRILHQYEPVVLLIDKGVDKKKVEEKLLQKKVNLSRVFIFRVPLNDVWARDCGPVFIRKNTQPHYALTDWEYNAWGEKYPPFDDDNKLPFWFSTQFGIKRFVPKMVLEGGSVETNGEGLLLTTESVLLNSNRNPGMTRQEIETRLKEYLGIQKIIWLKKGLAGDDTDGHIDDLSRFLDPGTVLTMLAEDPGDVNYEALRENYEILKQAVNTEGKPLKIETLPMPETAIPGTTVDGSEYVPASYANFYIANGVVLVPLYDKKSDQQALNLFKKYFPKHDIAGVECADLVWGQGGIHCITQQLYGLNLIQKKD